MSDLFDFAVALARAHAATLTESSIPLNDPRYLAPYSDIDEGKEPRYESPESAHGVGATFR